MKQTQAVLLSDTDSGGGVLFWIRLKSVVLTQGGTKEKKMNEDLCTQAYSHGFLKSYQCVGDFNKCCVHWGMLPWHNHTCVFMETSIQAEPVEPPLPRPLPFISLPHTVSATAHVDSKVTNTLKVPLARGKTVKQNYTLEKIFHHHECCHFRPPLASSTTFFFFFFFAIGSKLLLY